MEAFNRALKFPFLSRWHAFGTLFIIALSYKMVVRYGWGLFHAEISLGAKGAFIAGCGGALLTWLSFLPRGAIVKMGNSSDQKAQLVVTAWGGAFASFIALLILMLITFGFLIGFINALASLIDDHDFVSFVFGIIAVCVIMFSGVIIGSSFTHSIPHWVDTLLSNAKADPRIFKRSIMRLGFALLVVGTFLQVVDGTSFPKCADFECKLERSSAPATG